MSNREGSVLVSPSELELLCSPEVLVPGGSGIGAPGVDAMESQE